MVMVPRLARIPSSQRTKYATTFVAVWCLKLSMAKHKSYQRELGAYGLPTWKLCSIRRPRQASYFAIIASSSSQEILPYSMYLRDAGLIPAKHCRGTNWYNY